MVYYEPMQLDHAPQTAYSLFTDGVHIILSILQFESVDHTPWAS